MHATITRQSRPIEANREEAQAQPLTEQVRLVRGEDGVYAAHERDRHQRGANEHAQRNGALKTSNAVVKQNKAEARQKAVRCIP